MILRYIPQILSMYSKHFNMPAIKLLVSKIW